MSEEASAKPAVVASAVDLGRLQKIPLDVVPVDAPTEGKLAVYDEAYIWLMKSGLSL